jgi:hypothetical protein
MITQATIDISQALILLFRSHVRASVTQIVHRLTITDLDVLFSSRWARSRFEHQSSGAGFITAGDSRTKRPRMIRRDARIRHNSGCVSLDQNYHEAVEKGA